MSEVSKVIQQVEHCLSICRAAGVQRTPPRKVLEAMLDATTHTARKRIAEQFAKRTNGKPVYEARGTLAAACVGIRQPKTTEGQFAAPGSLIAAMR